MAIHVRDTMTIDRATRMVKIALLPVLAMALYNTGHQANLVLEGLSQVSGTGLPGRVNALLGIGYDPWNVWACIAHGALHYLPVLLVAFVIAELWERLFAAVRRRPQISGSLLFALLFSLSLPPSVPLWQVALGASFGVVVGQEIFGGTGRNIVHPVLVGLALLYTAYPQQMLGHSSWTVVEGFTGATGLDYTAGGGIAAAHWTGANWMQAFIGIVPGAFGETSTLACVLGGIWLLVTRVASGRVIAGGFLGLIGAALVSAFVAPETAMFGGLGWAWHAVLGGFAFGLIFIATDPATSAITNPGRWIYGILIGVLSVVFRVANVAHPDGTMFAILFGSMSAPLIDYLVTRYNIAFRSRRNV